MEIPMPDGSKRVVNDPKEISQLSFGHNEITQLSYSVTRQLPLVVSATRNTLTLSCGIEVLDGSCGAGVTCLGYDVPPKVWTAIEDVKVFYVAHRSYSTKIAEEFKMNLLSTTEWHMVQAYIYNSGA
jgi:acetylornithine/succinyldiaminopimelate/putrescine aminotransferase